MKIKDVMSKNVDWISPDTTLAQAAQEIKKQDIGFLPVGENDKLIGSVTDRDIAIRAVARGKGPDTKVRDVMTDDVKYCFVDQELDEVTRNMGDVQVRRLPVVSRDKQLVGILSLGDVAMVTRDGVAGEALTDISRPGGAHSQTG